ncbi:MAG: LLM class flavin-dependent oxidoreductase [Caulobacterales bacterium]|nr:LLM class flavin-dependent oxidoreductase [Caulobacterales bacterium]
MTPLSVLDLAPVVQGSTVQQALRNSRDLAQHVERWGYNRFWLAEHHNMRGIASAATSVLIGHIAEATSTIRVGSGGIMLPNHAPLQIAEQFGTLTALYGPRIDLGLGRAPGTDHITARALRRTMVGDVDRFPADVVELMRYFQPAQPGQAVVATPGEGMEVPVWILGSSQFGAHLAAALGLPYAFASHFAPQEMEAAVAAYRDRFEPSAQLDKPYVMLALNVFAANTDEEAGLLFTSLQQAFVNLATGMPGRLPPPMEGYEERLDAVAKARLSQALRCSVVGSRDTVRKGLAEFIERTGADELIITGQIHDHAARLRSFELTAEANRALADAA